MRNDHVADGDGPGEGEGERSPIADAPTIEGYTIERELGRGGEAIVYLAREHALGRRVALKVLRPELAASMHSERFVQEIAFLARLTHTNILPLLAAGRSNGVLFYASPFIEGESLRSRIAREKQLSIPEAVRIAREVASALDYACRHDVIHRDIKPENVLLADGHAVVADFGIARAVDLATDHRLTPAGLGVGTLLYMSPEQANGESHVGGRADIYALGCVLYEMLVGSTPFHGRSASNIIAHHLASPVPSIRDVRPEVSQALEDVIMRALAKTPADRFDTAEHFERALSAALTGHAGWRSRVRAVVRRAGSRRIAVVGVAVMALTASALWGWIDGPIDMPDEDAELSFAGATLDSAALRLAVLAVGGSDTSARPHAGRLMRDALKRWTDVTAVDQVAVDEALGRWQAPLGSEQARDVAGRLGVGRFVRLGADRIGDSVDVTAALHDAASGRELADARARVGGSLAGAAPAFAALAESLLVPAVARHRRVERHAGTTSVRARTAYLAGHQAIEQWNLPLADSLFHLATVRDPRYAQALLWMAQVRSWRGSRVPLWQSAAVRANTARAILDAADTLASDALVALAERKPDVACALRRRATTAYPNDFAAWYGYADCLHWDNAVVRDSTIAGGWRFRSSYTAALDAYQRAFRLLPSVSAFSNVATVVKTTSTRVRYGRAVPPDTLQFRAYPSVSAESISFIPVIASEFHAGRASVRPASVSAAVERYRQLHRDLALAWRTATPASSDALEAVAMSLDLFGDAAALDTLRLARRLARTPDDRVRLTALEIWSRVKLSLPGNPDGLRVARRLADSTLRANPPATAPEPGSLTGLASLLGRATLAAEYARRAAALDETAMTGSLGPPVAALIAHAGLGGPRETLASMERDLSIALAAHQSADEKSETMREMYWALTIAFPDYRSPAIASSDTSSDYMIAILHAALRGDHADARRRLEALSGQRMAIHPTDLTFDALYPEAATLAMMGDDAAAAARVDPTLDELARVPVQTLMGAYAARAGPLVRAAALRAEVANRAGDRERARRYARAVAILWEDADRFLQPTVKQMKAIAR